MKQELIYKYYSVEIQAWKWYGPTRYSVPRIGKNVILSTVFHSSGFENVRIVATNTGMKIYLYVILRKTVIKNSDNMIFYFRIINK